jgi:hypothetical protein
LQAIVSFGYSIFQLWSFQQLKCAIGIQKRTDSTES